MTIYTIGFTKKNADKFFNLLKSNQVKKVIDVRLNNVSQLAGFAKRDDLIFFLREICNCEYEHIPDLAPTEEILKPYKKGEIVWAQYEEKFMTLMAQRNIEKHIIFCNLKTVACSVVSIYPINVIAGWLLNI